MPRSASSPRTSATPSAPSPDDKPPRQPRPDRLGHWTRSSRGTASVGHGRLWGMCGRFTLTDPDPRLLRCRVDLRESVEIEEEPRFNIAPTDPVLALRRDRE